MPSFPQSAPAPAAAFPSGVVYVGPSLGRSLLGLATAIALSPIRQP